MTPHYIGGSVMAPRDFVGVLVQKDLKLLYDGGEILKS